MTRFQAIIFAILLSTSQNIIGQDREVVGTQSGDLSLRIKSLTFMKDNEYANNIEPIKFSLVSNPPQKIEKSQWVEGYTLIGFLFQPELVYTPSGKVTIRAGTHLLKYAGENKFSKAIPVLSATVKLLESTSLTIGSLSGSEKHQLFDPHFSSERFYSHNSESGFQVTSSTDHLFNDNWLSWENYINKGDSIREVFTVGESFKYTSSQITDLLQFEIPVQVQFKHFGGQINNFKEHVETYFNIATGIRVNIDPDNDRFGQTGIEYLQFINGEFPKKPVSGITHGYASWYRLHYTYKAIYFGLYYWKSHKFFAPNGNSIYGSVIDIYSKFVVPNRKIITSSLFFTLNPESYITLYSGIESYYDVTLKRMDLAITLHLNFDQLFRLATIK